MSKNVRVSHVPCIETLASPAFAGDVFFMAVDARLARVFFYGVVGRGMQSVANAGLRPATEFLFAREGRIFIRLPE